MFYTETVESLNKLDLTKTTSRAQFGFIACQECKTKYKPAVKFERKRNNSHHDPMYQDTAPTWYIQSHPDDRHQHPNDRFIVIMITENTPGVRFLPGETKAFQLNYKIQFLKPGFFAKINTISTIDPEFKLVIKENVFYDEFFGYYEHYYYPMYVEITNKSNDVVVVEKNVRIGEIRIEFIPDSVDNSTDIKNLTNILSRLCNTTTNV